MTLNIRDHDKTRYEARKALIRENVERLKKMEPRARVELELVDVHGNIADAVTDENHKAIDYIYDAMKELGITPKTIAMRGGTDGSYISTQNRDSELLYGRHELPFLFFLFCLRQLLCKKL